MYRLLRRYPYPPSVKKAKWSFSSDVPKSNLSDTVVLKLEKSLLNLKSAQCTVHHNVKCSWRSRTKLTLVIYIKLTLVIYIKLTLVIYKKLTLVIYIRSSWKLSAGVAGLAVVTERGTCQFSFVYFSLIPNIFRWCLIYFSDAKYICPMANIFLWCQIYFSDVKYISLMPNIFCWCQIYFSDA